MMNKITLTNDEAFVSASTDTRALDFERLNEIIEFLYDNPPHGTEFGWGVSYGYLIGYAQAKRDIEGK